MINSLNAGTGRRLTPAEQADKTKTWPQLGDFFGRDAKRARQAGAIASNYPDGLDKTLLD